MRSAHTPRTPTALPEITAGPGLAQEPMSRSRAGERLSADVVPKRKKTQKCVRNRRRHAYPYPMEAFESFVAVALETEGFVVAGPVKFPVSKTTTKVSYTENQTHGYEVDLAAARADQLILATVKSYFGSRGVAAEHVTGQTSNTSARNGYLLLNDPAIRDGVIQQAAARYGYAPQHIWVRLYVGRFAGPTQGTHEARIRAWCADTTAGGGPIAVVGVHEVVEKVRGAAAHTQYRDNAVLVSLKVLRAAGVLELPLPDDRRRES